MKKKIDPEKAKNLEELEKACSELHAAMKFDSPERAVRNLEKILNCFSDQFFFTEMPWDSWKCGAFMELLESFFKQLVDNSSSVYRNMFNRLYKLNKPELKSISKYKVKCSEYLQEDREFLKKYPSFFGLKHPANNRKPNHEQVADLEQLFKKFIDLVNCEKIRYMEIIGIFTLMRQITESMFNLVYNFETIGHFNGEDLDDVVIPETRGIIDNTFRLYFEGSRIIERYRKRVAAIEEFGVPFWAEDNR
jgi:hypothetical protein